MNPFRAWAPGRRWAGPLLTMLVAAGLLAALFPGVVRQPGAYLFMDQGDALKNYYVLEYYTRYDLGHRFTGMNYPRGEHLNYLDLQPLLAASLAWARQAGLPEAATAGIGATNLGLLLALVLAAGVLCAILRRLLLPGWYAGLAALLITFLSPHLLRFPAHMSLGYACFVPVQWYCLMRILAAPRRVGWYVLLGVFNLLVGLLTPYHLAIGSFWLLACVPVLAWQRGWRASWPLLTRLTATALLPLLAFRGWLWLTDPISDRPTDPWGLLVAHANFRSVFGPGQEPLRSVWQRIFHTEDPIWEGQAYVGLVGGLVLLSSLWLAGRYLWAGRGTRVLRPVLPSGLGPSLWAAALLLLLSMAFPFRLPGLAGLTELLGPIKQFRALGRFAWPFYYVFSGYVAFYMYRLWRYLRQRRAPAFATMWLLPLLGLWAAEAAWQVMPLAEVIESRRSREAFEGEAGNYRQLLGWSAYEPQSFQAILPLPYFIVGTDKIDLEGSGQSVYQAYKASLNLHLPLLTLWSGRASVGETLALTQLLSSPLLPKPLLARLPSAKPILLLVTPQALTPAEQRLVGLGQLIKQTPDAALYALPVAALAATDLPAVQARAEALLTTLPARGGLHSTTPFGVLYEPFTQRPDRRGRLADGAFYEPKNKFSTLYDGPLPQPADTGRYEASVWISARMRRGLGNLQVKLYDATGHELVHEGADARHVTEVDGDWLRVALPFRRPTAAARLEVLFDSDDLLADDLLVRPLGTDVYWRDARGRPVLNGYRLRP